MSFSLNTERLRLHVFNQNRLIHRTGNAIRLLPFPANASDLKEEVRTELKDFTGVAGACFRDCLNLSHKNTFRKEDFIAAVTQKAGAPDSKDLKDILQKMAFDQHDRLLLFDTQVYPHIHALNENKTLNDIGRFIVAVFFDEADKDRLRHLARREPDNLFYKLILSCMPQALPGTPESEPYYQALPALKKLFQQDLATLTADIELFVSHFHLLIKFYLFRYVMDLTLKLNAFDSPAQKLFFSLSWEKLQGARLPLTNGWELFESLTSPMFSHAVLLELLNHIEGFGENPVSYAEIFATADQASEEERQTLLDSLDQLIALYQEGVSDVTWPTGQRVEQDAADPVRYRIKELFRLIEYQFNETSRGRARLAFQEWLLEFTRRNFSKRRGPWGNSLALDEDAVLLITRLCVANRGKIRLKDLWQGFESRGILLDSISRDHLVQYYEKINLLEKKSDSGDAQYVREFSYSTY